MKKNIRIVKILLIIFLTIFLLQNFVYAKSTIDTNIEIGKTNAINSSKEFTEGILGTIQAVGSVISVVALLIIGFRYMISSVEQKAEMKGILIYYVIGAVLVFATSKLLGVVYDVFQGINV